MPECPPFTDVGNSSALWTTTVASTTVYTCHRFLWTASKNGSVSFTMQLRNDPNKWFIDDISILRNDTEMLVNGGFESGSLSPWSWSEPGGSCSGYGAAVTSSAGVARTGSYGLWDGCTGCADQVAQAVSVRKGQQYAISFWLKARNVSSGNLHATFSIN